MTKKSRDVIVLTVSCDEFAEMFSDLVFARWVPDPTYTEYPFHHIMLDVDQTAARITKRVREELKSKQGGEHV